jgi:hypothetical protein
MKRGGYLVEFDMERQRKEKVYEAPIPYGSPYLIIDDAAFFRITDEEEKNWLVRLGLNTRTIRWKKSIGSHFVRSDLLSDGSNLFYVDDKNMTVHSVTLSEGKDNWVTVFSAKDFIYEDDEREIYLELLSDQHVILNLSNTSLVRLNKEDGLDRKTIFAKGEWYMFRAAKDGILVTTYLTQGRSSLTAIKIDTGDVLWDQYFHMGAFRSTIIGSELWQEINLGDLIVLDLQTGKKTRPKMVSGMGAFFVGKRMFSPEPKCRGEGLTKPCREVLKIHLFD